MAMAHLSGAPQHQTTILDWKAGEPSSDPIGSVRVGVVGTGFVVHQAKQIIDKQHRLEISSIFTRRPIDSVHGFEPSLLTNSIDELISSSDLIFESTGDPIHSTAVVEQALRAGKKVVTMNAELHVTTGSYLAQMGYITEADGDQPGATAVLRQEALDMGFSPLAYINIKGFLDPNPSRKAMEHWSKRQELSLAETTSFTDGTKLHIEQALCANAFEADIAQDGLIGGAVESIFDTDYLVDRARELGTPISDYVQCNKAPPGVFILAAHPICERLPHYGPYEKLMTKGKRAYLLLRPYHLCGLEVAKSLLATAKGAPPLLNNGPIPRISVAAIAKRQLSRSHVIDHAIGGFDVRGSAVKAAENPDHVPIGLLSGARFRHSVEPGHMITLADVDLSESRAVEIWHDELRPRFIRTDWPQATGRS